MIGLLYFVGLVEWAGAPQVENYRKGRQEPETEGPLPVHKRGKEPDTGMNTERS